MNKDVKQGDFFILSTEAGYSLSQQKEAHQVMECWDYMMTVSTAGGCITLPYSSFTKVDEKNYKTKYTAPYFEDNRDELF